MGNVLIIMSDEHNPFYSSVYGDPSILTPANEPMPPEAFFSWGTPSIFHFPAVL